MITTGPATARTAIPSQYDPTHRRPAAPQVEALRHDLQTVYGQLLHAEHVADGDHADAEARAYHHATTLLAGLLWSDAA